MVGEGAVLKGTLLLADAVVLAKTAVRAGGALDRALNDRAVVDDGPRDVAVFS